MDFQNEHQVRASLEQNNSEEPLTDNVLTCILITIIISSSDSKSKAVGWYHTAVRLTRSLFLHLVDGHHREDTHDSTDGEYDAPSREEQEQREENRRVFWLLYSMDRHWSLSYNTMPLIMDQQCKVRMPLPARLWFTDSDFCHSFEDQPIGPLPTITGVSFFEWFLPLMTVLGDIIWVHHQQSHPRLHACVRESTIAAITSLLENCMSDIDMIMEGSGPSRCSAQPFHCYHQGSPTKPGDLDDARYSSPANIKPSAVGESSGSVTATKLYAKFIVHVMYVLLHGRWDALELLSRESSSTEVSDIHSSFASPVRMRLSDWITSEHFDICSRNSITASEIMKQILDVDTELALTPYLFGIYLLHSSFILLLFADRMLDVEGSSNESVEQACNTIIRAHEVSFATLSVQYQRDFRRILRRRLYDVHNHHHTCQHRHANGQDVLLTGPSSAANGQSPPTEGLQGIPNSNLWVEVLQLYRWTPEGQGLGI